MLHTGCFACERGKWNEKCAVWSHEIVPSTEKRGSTWCIFFSQSDFEMEVEMNGDADARQRFESSLPENWVLCSSKTHTGRLYYFNSVTGESRWQHPLLPDMDSPVSYLFDFLLHVKKAWSVRISKYDTFRRNLDENLAKDQSFKVRSGTAYGSGFLFQGVTKRTPEDRSRSRVCH